MVTSTYEDAVCLGDRSLACAVKECEFQSAISILILMTFQWIFHVTVHHHSLTYHFWLLSPNIRNGFILVPPPHKNWKAHLWDWNESWGPAVPSDLLYRILRLVYCQLRLLLYSKNLASGHGFKSSAHVPLIKSNHLIDLIEFACGMLKLH